MTVVPDENLMTLICDACGDTVRATACVLPDAEVVWTLVSEHGWSGSPFATGPHRCPRCAPLPPDPTDPTDGGQPGEVLGIDYLEDVPVVSVAGDINLDGGDALRAALHGAVEVRGHVVVDLARVHLIDSTGLGLLVRAHRDARERGAVLCLAAPSRYIRTVLHTMRVDGLFPVFDTVEEAVAEVAGSNRAAGSAGAGAEPARRAAAAPVRAG
ncbi:STAS domain-containing protein [Micromonospora echinaurantiaca]|uniref:STAS domain-containing protein n=1 Tax=Micromonospora echinaurantiaca TaxID=47857 RepID=UPI00379BEF26